MATCTITIKDDADGVGFNTRFTFDPPLGRPVDVAAFTPAQALAGEILHHIQQSYTGEFAINGEVTR